MSVIYRPPPEHAHLRFDDSGLIRAISTGNARWTPEQALEALRSMPTHTLGRAADARCRTLHGDVVRTYIIDRNINYTNVCTARCTFCAFRRDHEDSDAYTLEPEAIYDKIAELVEIGGTQILMQGGMNSRLPLEWYTSLLKGIKTRFPNVHVHAFSPPEFIEFVHFFDPPGATLEDKIRWVMVRLRDAGLDSLPGGGGEIFSAPVRRKIGLGKCDADAWLTTMYVAHSLGMFTSATMMFGHIEGLADRVHHMMLVRSWQDRALRGGPASEGPGSGNPHAHAFGHYKAFIAWPFQRENTPLGRLPEWGADEGEYALEFPGDAIARAGALLSTGKEHAPDGMTERRHALPPGTRAADAYEYDAIDRQTYPTAHLFGKRVRMSSATDYLRTQAVSRLFLDNIYSIGASWVTMGPHVGQVALGYGANDMGSVMMEENVVSSAGTTYCLDEALLCRLIRESGFLPAQRNNTYDVLRTHVGQDSPDLRVTDWSEHRVAKLHQQAPKVVKASVSAKSTAGSR